MNAKYDLVGFGEASIDEVWRLPAGFALGDKGRALGRDRLGGGQVATALVAAARLGARTAYLGPIGDDAIAREIVAGLHEDGVDSLALPARGASRTALLVVTADGERTVVEDGGVVAAVAPALPATRALHVDGTQVDAAIALATEARAKGVLVSIDLDAAVARSRRLIELADLCLLSEGLPRKLGLDLRALAELAPSGALVAETRGARGLVAWIDGAAVEVPAFPVDVVDTTACGDTLRGALVVAWLEGLRGQEALRFASAAAALKCRGLGRRGCPRRAEVEALLRA